MKIFKVGGAVRDRLMGLEPKDEDFVIVGATVEELEAKGFTKTVGADFPVFLKDGCEFALARTERKVGLGHTAFETTFDKTVTLEEDLMRRDLTINAMAEDLETGLIIDPFGGREDLKRGLIRHVSPAFSEDPLRVLRAARFAARFGFMVAPETIKLMRHLSTHGELRTLTKERVWSEVSRAMMESEPQNFFRVLGDVGALEPVFGEMGSIIFDGVDMRLMRMANSGVTETGRWMGLFFDAPVDIFEHFDSKISWPNDIRDAAKFAIEFNMAERHTVDGIMDFCTKWRMDKQLKMLFDMIPVMKIVSSESHEELDRFVDAISQISKVRADWIEPEKLEGLVGPEIGQAIKDMQRDVLVRFFN